MSELGTYSFIPWVRQGIANAVQAPAAGAARATVQVDLTVKGSGGPAGDISTPVSQPIEMYGPGDVVGIDPKAIIQAEPRNWISNFEPNYLPYICFADPDFAWRQTPAPPNGDRLDPWIMLVVLAEGEFADDQSVADRPLPAIKIDDPDTVLPPSDNLWAWAHVHVNERMTEGGTAASAVLSSDAAAIAARLASAETRDPDLAFCRIVSPRKLAPKTKYHAFLVPVFETGRLVGLGRAPEDAPGALHKAWRDPYPGGGKPDPQIFPYYYRWFFQTSVRGDFEYLVRLLKPRVADARIGRRDFDTMAPGAALPPIDNEGLGGVLRIGGALQAPFDTLPPDEKAKAEAYEKWAEPPTHPFVDAMADLLNLPDDYANAEDPVPDPVIAPPIYGKWHAQVERVLEDRDGNPVPNTGNWLHDLNLDPQYRAAAGYGTEVIRKNQEDYMKEAWAQIGDVIAANRRMRLAQLGRQVLISVRGVHLAPRADRVPGMALMTMAPLAPRVMVGGATARHRIAQSRVPLALVDPGFRAVARPRGRLARKVAEAGPAPKRDIVDRVDRGEVRPTPPKTTPEALPTDTDIDAALEEEAGPLARPGTYRLLAFLGLILLILALFAAFALPLALLLGLAGLAALVAAFIGWGRNRRYSTAVGVDPARRRPEDIDRLPASPDFRITLPGDGFRPASGVTDSPEAQRYKVALKDFAVDLQAAGTLATVPDPVRLNVPAFTADLVKAVDPKVTMPRRIFADVKIPAYILTNMVEFFAPVMAHPVFDIPMYKPLSKLSDEHFVPNLRFLRENSITLLETNQKFIESYMVGLNHEMSRELHWREYLTDMRGTYFRQFWDVSSFFDPRGPDDPDLREELRDIPPIHIWPRASDLGDHDHRDRGGEAENELAVGIRGELFNRYPNTVIYMQRAEWQRDEDGNILRMEERRLVELTEEEEDNPPTDKIKLPLYEAKVDPDIYFFGFDLTATEAKGESGANNDDDAGWIVVMKERPGEPRFGFDVTAAGGARSVWNDFAWPDVLQAGQGDGDFLVPLQNHGLTEPGETDERREQWEEDRHVPWSNQVSAAELAYIMYQAPVMVGVHASEMLPR